MESQFLLWLQDFVRSDWGDAFFTFYTSLGNGGLAFILVGLALLPFKKTRKAGIMALGAMLVGLILTNLTLKPLVDRTRPWVAIEGLVPLVETELSKSFPSGHTTAAFAFAAGIWHGLEDERARWVRWAKGIALAAAVLMGFSRLYVGVHYPTDVLGGVVVGLLAGWVAKKAYEAVETRFRRSEK